MPHNPTTRKKKEPSTLKADLKQALREVKRKEYASLPRQGFRSVINTKLRDKKEPSLAEAIMLLTAWRDRERRNARDSRKMGLMLSANAFSREADSYNAALRVLRTAQRKAIKNNK